VVCDLNLENAHAVVAEIQAIGTQAMAIQADVTNEGQVNAMVSSCIESFGKVDILVNNAGIVYTLPLGETSAQDWDRVITVNLKSVFLCCKAVFPAMIGQSSGKIINIASVAGKRGWFTGELQLFCSQRWSHCFHQNHCPRRRPSWH